MPPVPAASRVANTPDFEADARRIAANLDRGKYLVLLLITILYAVGAALHARSKPLWYDELVTLVAASTPDAATTWKTAQAFDANPPLIHVFTHYAMQWFGGGEIATRLPAIAGFWIFCLCMFRFTRRRVGIYYGFVALLLPIATEAYSYAFEARAYGPELAFCGIALIAWQSAAEAPRRFLAHLALGLSLIGAIFCHYYAILVYLPLAGAEVYRSWHARRIDWGMWIAFGMGGLPVVWRMATITRVIHGFSQATWAPAYPEQVIEFWQLGLQHALSFTVLLLAIIAIWMMRPRPGSGIAPLPAPVIPAHELLAGVLFLAIPMLAVGGALFVTHMFTMRYALLSLMGVSMVVPFVAARLSGGRALAGFLLMIIAILPLLFVDLEIPPLRHPFTDEKILAQALEKGEVVVSDGQLFLQMWHYAPDNLKQRLLFVADEASAVKYMGYADMDLGLRNVSRWSTYRVVDYKDFATPGKEFLVYHNSLSPGWLMAGLMANGSSAEIQAYSNFRQLYRVRIKGPAVPEAQVSLK